MKPLSPAATQRFELIRAAAEAPATALLAALAVLQNEHLCVGQEEIAYLAEFLGLSGAHVQGVARFYDRITANPTGRHILALCEGISCYLRGAEAVAEGIGQQLGIEPGGVTADGRFAFRRVACLGACEQAPVMHLDAEAVGPLAPESIGRRLEELTREGGRDGAHPHG